MRDLEPQPLPVLPQPPSELFFAITDAFQNHIGSITANGECTDHIGNVMGYLNKDDMNCGRWV